MREPIESLSTSNALRPAATAFLRDAARELGPRGVRVLTVLPGIGGGTLALIAIVTGVIARGEIKRSGEQGMWMATVGILLGILHLLVIALIFIFLIGAIFVIGGWALLHH